MAAVDAERGTIAWQEERPLSEVRKGFTSFSDGDVLFAKITPCMENGKAALAHCLKNGHGFGSTEFHVLTPRDGVSSRWIFYFVRQQSFRNNAKAGFTGTAGQLRVPRSFLVNYPIALAPTAEQQRIVSAIEQQFSRLDAGVTTLKEVQAKLKRYRAAVLKAAVEGTLTAAWRAQHPDVEPASVLLQRILHERRSAWEQAELAKLARAGKTPPIGWQATYREPASPDVAGDQMEELPRGWTCVRLEQVASLITSGSRGWAKYYSNPGALFIRAQNINTDELRLESVAFVKFPSSTEGTRTRVMENDLLVTITGANVTKTAIVRQTLSEAYVSQHVGLIRPVLASSAAYLYYWIISPDHCRRILEQSAYGAGRPGLNLDNLRDLLVALPPLAEQEQIVAEVERRLSVVAETEAQVEADLKRAERLRQGILKQAFAGKLVSQDPEDEPAGVLLERLRSQRRAGTDTGRLEKAAQLRLV